jgi:hypothetical protein
VTRVLYGLNQTMLIVLILLCLRASFFHPFSPDPLVLRLFMGLFAVRLAWMVGRRSRRHQNALGRTTSN